MRSLLGKALMVGGLLVLGMVIGVVGGRLPVFASVNLFQPSSPANVNSGDYCHFYEAQLASNLHVSTSDLEQANKDALQKTIDQMANDGKITPAEQMALDSALQQAGTDPCTNLPKVISSLMNNPALKAQLTQAHNTLVTNVAKTLHLLPATLDAELSQGKTMLQIAQEQNVAISEVNGTYLNTVQVMLTQLVQQQDITQDQYNLLYGLAVQAVSQGHYPLLEPVPTK